MCEHVCLERDSASSRQSSGTLELTGVHNLLGQVLPLYCPVPACRGVGIIFAALLPTQELVVLAHQHAREWFDDLFPFCFS